MKVLWITNILFSHHREMMGLKGVLGAGGSWLYAAYNSSLNNPDCQLYIATSANVPKRKEGKKDGNTFYILPGGVNKGYDIDSVSNLKEWKRLRKEVKPDVVIIWGTETRFAYLAMKAMAGIHMAIYMQGVMKSIYGHYYEGVPHKYIKCTIRDYVDSITPDSPIRTFREQERLEHEMFGMAEAVIVENDWCEDVCKGANPNLKVYRNMLPIREEFYSATWSKEKMNRKTIFTNAGGYPIKGHHILFKALSIVKKTIPDFRCFIPGEKLISFIGVKRKTGYVKLLETIIREGDLRDNIIYTGALTSAEMANYLASSNVYVMPSVMENHSSSLIEAMIVGTPSISSLVGGTASLVEHKKNGILYNSLDAESLAGNIIRLLEDDELAEHLSVNAVKIREKRSRNFGDEMLAIYKSLNNQK